MTLGVLSFAWYRNFFLSSFSKKNQKSLTFEYCKSQLFFALMNFRLLPLISYLSGLLYVSTKQKFLAEGISSYLSGKWHGGVCRHIEKLEPSWRKELVFPLQLGYCPPACIMVLATNFYDRCFAFAIPYYAALICVHSTLCRLHHYQASSPAPPNWDIV